MTTELRILKARALLETEIEDFRIIGEDEFPADIADMKVLADTFHKDAEAIFQLLSSRLPGGTLDALFAIMAKYKASQFIVPYERELNLRMSNRFGTLAAEDVQDIAKRLLKKDIPIDLAARVQVKFINELNKRNSGLDQNIQKILEALVSGMIAAELPPDFSREFTGMPIRETDLDIEDARLKAQGHTIEYIGGVWRYDLDHTKVRNRECANCKRHEVELYAPPHVYGDGEVKPIRIDACIVNDLFRVWGAGYRTLSSCCGHGNEPPWVLVDPDADAMEIRDIDRLLTEGGRLWTVKQWKIHTILIGNVKTIAELEKMDEQTGKDS